MIKRAMMRIGTLTLFTLPLPLALLAAAAPRIETGFLDREVTLGSVSYRYQAYGGTDVSSKLFFPEGPIPLSPEAFILERIIPRVFLSIIPYLSELRTVNINRRRRSPGFLTFPSQRRDF